MIEKIFKCSVRCSGDDFLLMTIPRALVRVTLRLGAISLHTHFLDQYDEPL